MATYNPSTGLLDIEETPFRLLTTEDLVATRDIYYRGVLLDPNLYLVVDDVSLNLFDLSGNVDNINQELQDLSSVVFDLSQNVFDIDNELQDLSSNVVRTDITEEQTIISTLNTRKLRINSGNDSTSDSDSAVFWYDGLYGGFNVKGYPLFDGTTNAVNFYASAGLYIQGYGIIFSGDNQDVVIRKDGTNGKSLLLQAGDDGIDTEHYITFKARDTSRGLYTSMRIDGKNERIEINKELFINGGYLYFNTAIIPPDPTRRMWVKSTNVIVGTPPFHTTYTIYDLMWENMNITADLSQALVDISTNAINISGLDTRLTTAEGNISTNTSNISGLDTRLTTAEGNISTNTSNISGLDTRLTTAEGNISTNTSNISGLDTRLTTAEGNISTNTSNISTLQGDYVSKSTTTLQTLESGLRVKGSFTGDGSVSCQTLTASTSSNTAGRKVELPTSKNWKISTLNYDDSGYDTRLEEVSTAVGVYQNKWRGSSNSWADTAGNVKFEINTTSNSITSQYPLTLQTLDAGIYFSGASPTGSTTNLLYHKNTDGKLYWNGQAIATGTPALSDPTTIGEAQVGTFSTTDYARFGHKLASQELYGFIAYDYGTLDVLSAPDGWARLTDEYGKTRIGHLNDAIYNRASTFKVQSNTLTDRFVVDNNGVVAKMDDFRVATPAGVDRFLIDTTSINNKMDTFRVQSSIGGDRMVVDDNGILNKMDSFKVQSASSTDRIVVDNNGIVAKMDSFKVQSASGTDRLIVDTSGVVSDVKMYCRDTLCFEKSNQVKIALCQSNEWKANKILIITAIDGNNAKSLHFTFNDHTWIQDNQQFAVKIGDPAATRLLVESGQTTIYSDLDVIGDLYVDDTIYGKDVSSYLRFGNQGNNTTYISTANHQICGNWSNIASTSLADSASFMFERGSNSVGGQTFYQAWVHHRAENNNGVYAWANWIGYDTSNPGAINWGISTGNKSASRRMSIGYTGDMFITGSYYNSDRRIKKEITEIPDNEAYDIVKNLNVYTYYYIDKERYGKLKQYGWIAQEVRELVPQAIFIGSEDILNEEGETIKVYDFHHLNKDKLTPILWSAVQELQKRQETITDHTATIVKLREEVANQKLTISSLESKIKILTDAVVKAGLI